MITQEIQLFKNSPYKALQMKEWSFTWSYVI